jgi:thiamine-monophosphate kinase
MTRRPVQELALIRLIRSRAGQGRGVRAGIGDDCAVLDPEPGAALLATTDLLIEDIHFRRAYASPADVGWKALAVNLSDIAAMGGRPRWALVALACPASTEVDEVEAFYDAAMALARQHEVTIVGGDTSASPSGWIVNVTLLGETSRRRDWRCSRAEHLIPASTRRMWTMSGRPTSGPCLACARASGWPRPAASPP